MSLEGYSEVTINQEGLRAASATLASDADNQAADASRFETLLKDIDNKIQKLSTTWDTETDTAAIALLDQYKVLAKSMEVLQSTMSNAAKATYKNAESYAAAQQKNKQSIEANLSLHEKSV